MVSTTSKMINWFRHLEFWPISIELQESISKYDLFKLFSNSKLQLATVTATWTWTLQGLWPKKLEEARWENILGFPGRSPTITTSEAKVREIRSNSFQKIRIAPKSRDTGGKTQETSRGFPCRGYDLPSLTMPQSKLMYQYQRWFVYLQDLPRIRGTFSFHLRPEFLHVSPRHLKYIFSSENFEVTEVWASLTPPTAFK